MLAWRLSNTMNTGFCIEALEAAHWTGTPEIFNTDSENDAAGCSLMADPNYGSSWSEGEGRTLRWPDSHSDRPRVIPWTCRPLGAAGRGFDLDRLERAGLTLTRLLISGWQVVDLLSGCHCVADGRFVSGTALRRLRSAGTSL